MIFWVLLYLIMGWMVCMAFHKRSPVIFLLWPVFVVTIAFFIVLSKQKSTKKD